MISDDGGDTWRVVGGRLTDDFTVLEAATDRIAYAGGRAGALARTTDAGQTWANVSPPTSLGIRRGCPDGLALFVLADDGTVQRSDNGGASYRLLNTGTPVGARDHRRDGREPRRRHRDTRGSAGRSTAARRSRRCPTATSAERPPDGRYRRVGHRRRRAAAAALLPERRPHLAASAGRPSRIHDISFVSTQTGYLVDVSFRLWKTTNAGRTWTEPVSTGRPMTQVDFADARNGYVVVPRVGLEARGFVLRTSDGGASWRPQLVSPAFVRGVDMAGGTAYALAGTNFLYATTSGGDVGTARALMITTREGGFRSPPRSPSAAGSPPPSPASRRSCRCGSRFVALAGRDRRLERHVRHPLARFRASVFGMCSARPTTPERHRSRSSSTSARRRSASGSQERPVRNVAGRSIVSGVC